MIRVENKKTIRHVADISFRTEKMRNLFAVIAIILTTVLFCSLFAISSSLLASVEESTMRQVGGNAHGGFKYLTPEQYERLSKHPDIKEISYSVVLASAENPELSKRPTEIRYAKDALEAEMMFSMPTTGRLPEAKNEIATDTLVLEQLGIPAKLGEVVTLQYSVGETAYQDSFILVGFWEGDIIMSASQAWLSREYVEEILSKHDLSQEEICGSINAEVNFNNSWNIESKLIKVITESGYFADEIDYGVNWAYMGSESLDTGTVLGVVMIVLIITFCGYLMISNVFMISVAKDVHFYGLLKTIGTTGKQMKVLIRRQAMRISLIGIPIGLFLGSLVGSALTPFVLEILNTNVVKIAIRWWVFLFAALFAWGTVFISIHKAEKVASRVSPIEALRMTEAIDKKKKNSKPGQKISLWKMAGENVGRNRRKVVLVTLSLSFSLIILNSAYSMADSFDMDAYLDNMISHDFVIGDVSWFNVYSQYVKQDTLNDSFLKELSKHSGIESLEKIYFSENICNLDEHWNDMAERIGETFGVSGQRLEHIKEEIESGKAIYHVYGIDDAVWDDITVWQGEIDLEKLHSGKYVAVSPHDTEGQLSAYQVGDMIEVFSQTGESRSCEILAIASIPYNISIQHSHPVDIDILVPSDIFLQEVEQKCPMIITLDVEAEKVDEIEQFLAGYCKEQDPNMQYTSKATYVEEYENTQRTYKVVGMVASILLAFIGIANFTNTSITSMVARKRELALLESIGMTIRQQRAMLIFEGLIYMLLTFAFTATIGTLIGSYGMSMLLGNQYYKVHFTIIPAVVCMPIFLMIAVLIPVLSQRYVNGESVVERLRMTE